MKFLKAQLENLDRYRAQIKTMLKLYNHICTIKKNKLKIFK